MNYRLPTPEITQRIHFLTGFGVAAPAVDGSRAQRRLATLAHRLYAARRQRDAVLGLDLAAEPAWDMLLDLYIQEAAGRRISVSSVCFAAAAPATTALRHLDALIDRGLVDRQPDATDRRRSWVGLSAAGRALMQDCLTRIDTAWSR